MSLINLIKKNRSYRRFHQEEILSNNLLKELINLARLSSSARNMQSLRYVIVNSQEENKKVFDTLIWAAYIKDWDGPEEGERPAAYMIQLNDTSLSDNYFCDDGIAAQSILLGAVEKGYGGCIIGSVNRAKLAKELNISDRYKIIQVIALGKPKEEVVIEEIKEDNFHYWRDNNQVHHVPKRNIDDLILSVL